MHNELEKPKVKPPLSRSRLHASSQAEIGKEAVLWLDKFAEQMALPGEQEEEFFERRRLLQLGVGLDEKGNLFQAVTTSKD